MNQQLSTPLNERVTGAGSFGVRVAAYGDFEPRLITSTEREDAEQYRGSGGYAVVSDIDALLLEVEKSGIRGRGGAAFPLAQKLRTVRASTSTPIVLANGEEGEPASVKDRWLMRYRPHLVLDGVRLTVAMVGADDAYLYVSDPASAASLRAALDEIGSLDSAGRVVVHEVEGTYVAGEETAAVRSINGGPALPQEKPPRPFQAGIDNRPTLVSNVETLANLPSLLAHGADVYRSLGTDDSSGTFLCTLTGIGDAGLYELPFGTTLREVLAWLDHDTPITGALVGGYFAGVMSDRILDVPLDYGSVRAAGGGLGCGAIAIIDESTCPVDVTADVLAYFDRENAGQCGSCFNGTAAMAAAASAIRDGRAEDADVERLRGWSQALRGRGACGTLDGAANVAAALLREFPERVEALVASPRDGGRAPIARPFAVFEDERKQYA